jgi:hypothetical protein
MAALVFGALLTGCEQPSSGTSGVASKSVSNGGGAEDTVDGGGAEEVFDIAGKTLVPAASGLDFVWDIAYGNGKFVAAGSIINSRKAAVSYSTDGASWTALDLSAPGLFDSYVDEYHHPNVGMRTIAYGGPAGAEKFVAGATGYMGYSTDGINWTMLSNPFGEDIPSDAGAPFAYEEIYRIRWVGGKFVASGIYGRVAYSPDGIDWTLITIEELEATSSSILDFAYGDGKYVAVGYGYGREVGARLTGRVAYSSDLENWTVVEAPYNVFPYGIVSVAYGNGKFIAGGNTGKIAYSTDGINWTAVANTGFLPDDDDPFRASSVRSIIHAGDKFIAAGGGYPLPRLGEMSYSEDGISWTKLEGDAISESSINALAYGNGRLVAGHTMSNGSAKLDASE